MKETLICKLEKHNIYYVSNNIYGYYILVPFKDYNDTNIVVRLKSNYQNYDLNKNPLDVVTNELINYYRNLDNYNITLILPVFYDDILSRIITVEDMEKYYLLDKYLGEMFNSAYKLLTKNNIKVNSNIYVINNDSFKKFTNWFVSRYNNRIEYKTILELIKKNDEFNSYNIIETPNMNFVVSKNEEPNIEKTVQLELETFDNISKEMEVVSKKLPSKKEKNNAGYVSYVLLGIIAFVVSLVLLWFFIK